MGSTLYKLQALTVMLLTTSSLVSLKVPATCTDAIQQSVLVEYTQFIDLQRSTAQLQVKTHGLVAPCVTLADDQS